MDEKSALTTLLRCAVQQTPCEPWNLEVAGWWRLFRLAQQNRVAGMVAEELPTGVPREVLMPWLAEREKVASRHRYQQRVQQDLVLLMQKHGIDTLVLKGTSTARYYPIPELREFGDLDLYFYDNHAKADQVAAAELRVDISSDSHHHTKYHYRGITIESHHLLLNTHYPPSNKPYEALLCSLLGTPEERPLFEVLYLLRHAACHFAAGRLVLRDLCDWSLTCRALRDKVDWQRAQHVVEEYGMTAFAAALNQIAYSWLGDGAPWQFPRMDTRRVEDDLIYGGDLRDHDADGLDRLRWKTRRWRANAWKRRMVCVEGDARLLIASLTAHALKPRSIMHKI